MTPRRASNGWSGCRCISDASPSSAERGPPAYRHRVQSIAGPTTTQVPVLCHTRWGFARMSSPDARSRRGRRPQSRRGSWGRTAGQGRAGGGTRTRNLPITSRAQGLCWPGHRLPDLRGRYSQDLAVRQRFAAVCGPDADQRSAAVPNAPSTRPRFLVAMMVLRRAGSHSGASSGGHVTSMAYPRYAPLLKQGGEVDGDVSRFLLLAPSLL